jgi:hypothetical protein
MMPTFHSQSTVIQSQPTELQQQDPPQQMYFALGHGDSTSEVRRNITNTILIKKVRCGYPSGAQEAYKEANVFFTLFSKPDNWDFFTNTPELTSSTNSRLSNFIRGKTRTHPSQEFVDGVYTPLTDFVIDDKVKVFTSGLHSNNSGFIQKGVVLDNNEHGEPLIGIPDINVIFKHALYPSNRSVVKLFVSINFKHKAVKNDDPIPFFYFKKYFIKYFEISINQLLEKCDELSNGKLSILYYPLCREIKGKPSEVGLKLSDETNARNESTTTVGGTRKRRKTMHRKRRKTMHCKRQNKK